MKNLNFIKLDEIFGFLFLIKVYEEDGLPNMICHPCKYQLEKSYQFKKKCEAADFKLRKHMKLINHLTGQEETDQQEDDHERPSSSGKSKQVKQLLADLVSTKGNSSHADGDPIEVTEEELVGGYILGKIVCCEMEKFRLFLNEA